MCDKWEHKDNRIKVIHKENGGLSSARNAGIEIAKGEYVGFVDSDDWLSPDTIRAMMNEFEQTELDLVASSITFDYEDGKAVKFEQPAISFNLQINVNDFFRELYNCFFFNAVYAKLYKKSILEKYDIQFDRHYSILEDSMFVLNYLQHTKHICCLSLVGYHYRQLNEESLVKKYNENEIEAYRARSHVARFLENILNSENSHFYETSVFNELWGVFPKLYYRSGLNIKQIKCKTISILNDEYFQSVCTKAYFKYCNPVQKIKLILCKTKCWWGIHILLSLMRMLKTK